MALAKLSPRALRAEVGSPSRLVDGVFRSPSFLPQSRGFQVARFLQKPGNKLLVERGDESEDVGRIIIGAINLLVTEHWRAVHPVAAGANLFRRMYEREDSGNFERRRAGETGKAGLSWYFMCQHPNFPNGPEGFFANCQRKEIYRSTYEIARKMAPMIVAGLPMSDDSRASRIDSVTNDIVKFKAGWRWVIDHAGARKEYVPMLENGWVDWPGLREEKEREKLCEIYARPEYARIDPTPSPSTSAPATPPSSSSPGDSSAASRLKRKRGERKPPDGSAGSDDGNASG